MIDKPIPNPQFPLPKRCVREGAIALDEVLKDIEVPSLDVPDLDASFTPSRAKDLFAEKSRAAWKDVQQAEARCDFAPNKVRISYRNPAFGIISLWSSARPLSIERTSRSMAGLSPTSRATPIWSGNSPWV